MQLAPAPAPSPAPSTVRAAGPTYVGLRVSADREFSAPMFAANLRDLEPSSLDDAVVAARAILTDGGFDEPGATDPAKAVAILHAAHGGFDAGTLGELRLGRLQQVGMPVDDARFEFWFEPKVAAIVDRHGVRLTG